jgi:hypothetical protein
MRDVQASLFQAAPSTLTLPELVEELTNNLGVPSEALAAFSQRFQSADVMCAGDLCSMTLDAFNQANAGALDSMHVKSLCICLGSANMPHEFTAGMGDAGASRVIDGVSGAEEEEQVKQVKPEGKPNKGGATRETAEVLEERRDFLLPGAYHVPPAFDRFYKTNPGRNMKQLRKLIVQEILEVCGDLYPDANERAVILGAIEDYCGPPVSGMSSHYDNWRDPETRVKHKGTAISDLEKARSAPESYGVSKRSVPGRMRPVRLKRTGAAPPSADLVPSTSGQRQTSSALEGLVDLSAVHTGGTGGGTFGLETDDLDAELGGLDEVKSIEEKVKDMQASLDQLKKKKAAASDAIKAAKSAAKAAAKASTTGDTENAGGNTKKRKRTSPPGTAINKRSQEIGTESADKESELVPFEQSEVAKSYQTLPYNIKLIKTGTEVAVLSQVTKEWVVGKISAVDIRAKTTDGQNISAVWYRLGASKRGTEYIMCQSEEKEEKHGSHYVFVQPAPSECASRDPSCCHCSTSPDSYRMATR